MNKKVKDGAKMGVSIGAGVLAHMTVGLYCRPAEQLVKNGFEKALVVAGREIAGCVVSTKVCDYVDGTIEAIGDWNEERRNRKKNGKDFDEEEYKKDVEDVEDEEA